MTVAILLATKNGARWLPAQLDSLLAQSFEDWQLFGSDDGSTDDTRAILQAFAKQNPNRLGQLSKGPNQGSAANFLSLLSRVPNTADFVAFCDQDDVWFSDKLSRATAALSASQAPTLYASRTVITDAALGPKGVSPNLCKTPSFANALVQSLAGGNTMVLNRTGIALARAHAPKAWGTTSHDWWLYQLITATGGKIIYDTQPCLFYRQHRDNQVGENRSIKGLITRASHVSKGRFRGWNQANIHALNASLDCFTPEARATFHRFCAAREAGLLRRLIAFPRSGIHRQSALETAYLRSAGILGLV